MASAAPPDTPAAVKLHCAEALHAEMSPPEQMERAKIVMQASQRMPAVGFFGARYGERWHVDMVALPHNAVRRQLYDAFVMANALAKMSLDVPDGDLARVYGWLGSLERFVDATLEAEHRFLYPVVDSLARKKGVALPEMLTPRGRRDAREQILELLATARRTRDVSISETAAKINALRYALDQFGANILDYYASMERFLPKFLKTHVKKGEKTKDKVEKAVVQHMYERPSGAQLVALLMQCIESRSRRTQFLARHFRKEKLRDAFKQDVRQIQATHMQLARVFDQTSNKYERVFSVKTFLNHYGANVNNEETLNLLGDIDLNDEGDLTIAAPADAPTEMLPESDPAFQNEDEDFLFVRTAEDDAAPQIAAPPAPQGGVIMPPPEYDYGDAGPGAPSDSPETYTDDDDDAYVDVAGGHEYVQDQNGHHAQQYEHVQGPRF